MFGFLGKLFSGDDSKQYFEVAQGWPAYSRRWLIYEHDRKRNVWRVTYDNLFADERPNQYDIDVQMIVFEKSATAEEVSYVNKLLAKPDNGYSS
jgi:hypothetical protein